MSAALDNIVLYEYKVFKFYGTWGTYDEFMGSDMIAFVLEK